MATSPIYNWPEPDNTDLVKNGALAIRTLGNAIDTTMGTMVAKTVVDAKGDLIAGTAADTVNRLAVGANGETLVADSSTSTGLRYQGNFAAGKNYVINGDLGIWQRGTTFTNVSASFQYTADRFQAGANAATTTHTITRQSFTPGAAPVAGYEGKFFYRSTLTNIGSATAISTYNKIEDVQTLAGQTATFSFWAKADSARNLNYTIEQNFGSGGSATVSLSSTNSTLSTSWTRYSVTVAVPSISGKTIGSSSYLLISFNQAVANGSVLDIWGVQLEAGSVATAFQTATGTIQGELAACQRYYYRQGGDAPFQGMALGVATSTTNGSVQVALPVQMRVAPTSIDFSTLGLYSSGSVIAVTTATIDTASKNIVRVNAAVSSGLTQDRAYQLLANNSTSALIGFSAEL